MEKIIVNNYNVLDFIEHIYIYYKTIEFKNIIYFVLMNSYINLMQLACYCL